MSQLASVPLPDFAEQPAASDAAALGATLDASGAQAKAALSGMDDDDLMATWRVMNGETEVMAMPRIGFIRAIMLNHWYHHRG